MKEAIEKILNKLFVRVVGYESLDALLDEELPTCEIVGIPEAAAAIAAKVEDWIHEAEMEQGFMLTEDHMAEEAKLEARLAEMRAHIESALEMVDISDEGSLMRNPCANLIVDIHMTLKEALAAGEGEGRVLWAGQAKFEVYYGAPLLILPDEIEQIPEDQPLYVTVTAIEEPPDAEEQMASD